MINSIREEKANFFGKDLFNILFHLINLCLPRVTNKREVIKADRANRVDGGKVDRKKAIGLGIAAKDLIVENLSTTSKVQDIALKNLGIVLQDLRIVAKNSYIVTENLVLENPGIIPKNLGIALKDIDRVLENTGIVTENIGITIENSTREDLAGTKNLGIV